MNRRLPLLGLFAVLSASPLVLAQQGLREDRSVSIDLDTLPAPPKELVELIAAADVEFVTGGEPQTPPGTIAAGTRFAGETRFEFSYKYNSRVSWKRVTSRQGNSAEIRVRFQQLALTSRHKIWLRNPPKPDQFWDDKLVLHEFDHVRISSHPGVEALFQRLVRRLNRIEVPLASVSNRQGIIIRSRVDQFIDQKVHETVEEVTQYVRIRYRELDQQTRHGLVPLPKTFALEIKPGD